MLFTTVNKLLQKESVKRYPPSPDTNVLVNSFADFFSEKIDKIHFELMQKQAIVCSTALTTSSCCQFEFSDFTVVSQDTIRELTHKLALKSCSLDPLPASLMKPDCLDLLLPTITKIVNMSLSSGVMLEALKVAELLPALKKPGADYKQFSNFRPISNLKMVSKVIEKAAAVQLINHVSTHLLDERFQSAYKRKRRSNFDSSNERPGKEISIHSSLSLKQRKRNNMAARSRVRSCCSRQFPLFYIFVLVS